MTRPGTGGQRRPVLALFPRVAAAGQAVAQVRTMRDRAAVAKMTAGMKESASSLRPFAVDARRGAVSLARLMPVQQTIAKKVQNRP